MKHMRKLLVLVMALAMVLSMGVNAFADDPATYTITAPATNHQYEIYQIFTGDLSGDVLSNVKWGANGKETAGSAVDKDTLAALEALEGKSDTEKLAVITPLANLESDPIATITNGGKYDAVPGYYLIKDKDNTVTGEDAYTTYLVKVVKEITITPKADIPSSEKKITEGSVTADAADYSVGDEVHYQLTATLPDDANAFAAYQTYFVNFVDDMSKGLTYKAGSAVIKVGDTQVAITEPAITASEKFEGGKTLRWDIADVKAAPYNAAAGQTITVEYTAILNGDAVVGNPGNPNKMHIEFDNNPNPSQAGTPEPPGTTPDDTNVVFTYETIFNKVEPEGEGTKPLTGADFKLEKKVGDNWVDVTTLHTGEGAVNPTKTGDTTGSTFTFSGLDAGDYKLTEITTPAGYNTIDPIEFKITAELEIKSDNPVIKSLTGTGEKIHMTADESLGTLTSDILNQKGATLPETGGMGTTVFYIIGGILVAGAVVVLITRRRMSNEK